MQIQSARIAPLRVSSVWGKRLDATFLVESLCRRLNPTFQQDTRLVLTCDTNEEFDPKHIFFYDANACAADNNNKNSSLAKLAGTPTHLFLVFSPSV